MPLVIRTTGKTGWAPGTRKFILYDWQTGTHPMSVAIGADATEVRTAPPTGPNFGAAEALAWKGNGAPLRCVAIVVVTKTGWRWTAYDGRLSWAKRNYRNGGTA